MRADTHGAQDYRCTACSYELLAHRAWWVPIPEGERRWSWETEWKLDPTCPNCHGAMVWIPKQAQTDLLREDFVVDCLDGGPRRISSVSELRTIERESEQRARNGEGSPIAFRHFSQDGSNRDVNAFRNTEHEKARSERIDPRTQSGRRMTGGARRASDYE